MDDEPKEIDFRLRKSTEIIRFLLFNIHYSLNNNAPLRMTRTEWTCGRPMVAPTVFKKTTAEQLKQCKKIALSL